MMTLCVLGLICTHLCILLLGIYLGEAKVLKEIEKDPLKFVQKIGTQKIQQFLIEQYFKK